MNFVSFLPFQDLRLPLRPKNCQDVARFSTLPSTIKWSCVSPVGLWLFSLFFSVFIIIINAFCGRCCSHVRMSKPAYVGRVSPSKRSCFRCRTVITNRKVLSIPKLRLASCNLRRFDVLLLPHIIPLRLLLTLGPVKSDRLIMCLQPPAFILPFCVSRFFFFQFLYQLPSGVVASAQLMFFSAAPKPVSQVGCWYLPCD